MWQRIRQNPDWQFAGIHALLVISLQTIGPEYFRFERTRIADGEIWRMITSHWVHVGWAHLSMNLLGLVICILLAHPRWSVRRWFIVSLCMGLCISLLIWLQNPGLQWYVGFSGILFGLYFLTAHDLYARDRLIALLMAGAIVVKVILEQFTSLDFDSSELIGAPVITDAHLYGLLSAIAIALVWSTYTMNHGTSERSN